MSDTCYWLTVLQLALALICVISFLRFAPVYGFAWSALAGLTLHHFILIFTPLALGNLSLLDPIYFRGVLIACTVILASFCAINFNSILTATVNSFSYRPKWLDLFIAVAIYLCIAINLHLLALGWVHGPDEFDALNYHIPRVLQWSWHGDFSPWPANTWQQIAHAYGGSASQLPGVFLGCGYRSYFFAGALCALGAALAVFVTGRSFKLSSRSSLLAALAFLSFPTVILRSKGVNTDLAAAFPVFAAIAFLRSCRSVNSAVFLFVALCGVGVAAKQYVLFPATVVALAFVFTSRQQLRNKALLVAALGGAAVGVFTVFLSYFPIYLAFGDINGGNKDLSNIGRGFKGVADSLGYTFINWLSEPFGLGSRKTAEYLFDLFRVEDLYRMVGMGLSKGSISSFNGNEMRSGVLSLLALPWLAFGVMRGYRLISVLGFLALVVVQMAPLSLNFTGRFILVPLGAFALLWGARAERSQLLVSLCIIAAFWITREKVGMLSWWPQFSNQINYSYADCKELDSYTKGDDFWLLTRPLATDARVVSRIGEGSRFEYLACPEEGDWVTHLRRSKDRYSWLGFFPEQGVMAAGPIFNSLFRKRSCQGLGITAEDFRGALRDAGWGSVNRLGCGLELWRAAVAPAAVGAPEGAR
jgi:hypothetical protein